MEKYTIEKRKDCSYGEIYGKCLCANVDTDLTCLIGYPTDKISLREKQQFHHITFSFVVGFAVQTSCNVYLIQQN